MLLSKHQSTPTSADGGPEACFLCELAMGIAYDGHRLFLELRP